ncbi:MAG: hypothetical protein HQL94_00980 [Magnetococcales bacterium]|nr:hypothetical protein [Magnetococcales bacterium]MBF0438812.1 hypothetical protein [Magnetococcales bacterium]
MKRSTNPVTSRSKSFMAWRLQQVAKIALITGAVALLCLTATLYYLAGDRGTNYQEILSAYSMTKRQLVPALLLSGFVLITLTSLITWMIALYSTYRIAGPLHRFGLNLKRQIQEGPLPVEAFREGDWLQEEHLHFSAAASRLQYHYDSMSELTDLAMAELQLVEPDLGGGLTTTLQQLKELDHFVKL